MRYLAVLPLLALAACNVPQMDVTLTGDAPARLCVITRGGAINPCCTTTGKTQQCKAPGIAAGTAFEVQLFPENGPTQVWTVGDNVYQGTPTSAVSFAFALTADSLAGTYTLPTGENARAAWAVQR